MLALTYQLEVEANGHEHLTPEPQMKKSVVVGPRAPGPDKVESIAGFHMPKKDDGVKDLTNQVENVVINEIEADAAGKKQDEEADEEYSDVESGEEEEDDDDGWITPGNIEQVKKSMNGVMETVQLDVACITTDFAMQNVMMQMGLHVVSLEGRLIHEARTYILRCYACYRTTSNVTKVFCPKCGNRTLKKVAVSLKEDGTMQIHISSRKRLTARGKKVI